MRYLLIYSLSILFLMQGLKAQNNRRSYFGGVFTPKGDFTALVVPVIFKDGCSTNPRFKNSEHWINGWSVKDGDLLPNAVDPETGDCSSWLFNRPEHFETQMDKVEDNISKRLYMATNGEFRFMGEIFKDSTGRPRAVEIDPGGGAAWAHMNRKALEAMKQLNPGLNLSKFDQRINNPQYKFDNSANPKPDKVVDYIIFIYRYKRNWAQQPVRGMARWPGSGGGFNTPAGVRLETYNGYKFSEGFTMMWNSGVFIHELAHSLYNAPHFWGANSTVGDYFYQPVVGWGPTSTVPMFEVFNAFEKWYIGHLPNLMTVDENSVMNSYYELDDYVTTGSAMRIEIPFSGGQYLWLENHAKLDPLDEHAWKGGQIDSVTLPGSQPGVYAYVEAVASSHADIVNALSGDCNGLKPLSAAGNYDYSYKDDNPATNSWGAKMYPFRKESPNPIAGINPLFFYRDDFNKDGKILMINNYNSAKNEGEYIAYEEVEPGIYRSLFQNLGFHHGKDHPLYFRGPAFKADDVLNMGSNPMVINYPKYDSQKKQINPVYLNGLEIRFVAVPNSHKIRVLVRYQQCDLNAKVRWAGNIVLPDIRANNKADLIINRGAEVLLVKSGTPNRHLPTEEGDFINPTTLKVEKGAQLLVKTGGRLIIEKGASLELLPGSSLKLEKRARLVVRPGGALLLNGQEIDAHPKAKILKP